MYQKGHFDVSLLNPLLTKVFKLKMEKEEDLIDACIGALCYTHRETKAQRGKAYFSWDNSFLVCGVNGCSCPFIPSAISPTSLHSLKFVYLFETGSR